MSDELKDVGDGPALGSDPFVEGDGTLPFLLRLRERTVRLVEAADPASADEPSLVDPVVHRPPDLGPPIPNLPGLEEPEEPSGWLDRLADRVLDRDEEERIQRIHSEVLRGSGGPYDPLGLHLRTSRRTLAVMKLLYRHYFRVTSSGHAVLPEKDGAILAANHGGLLPFDAAMCVTDVVLKGDPPRLPRAVVDRWAGGLPFVNVWYARVGQVIGTRENFRRLLRSGQLVLVFPEGMAATHKRAADRYQLQPFHLGFVEESLRRRAPIVPVAIVGPDDQAPILYDAKPLARLLRLPTFPITPTFPWLGLLGLLPYPVPYEISYGEPFRFYEEYPGDAVLDPHAVNYMAEQVRRRIQEMVDRRVLARRNGRA